MASLRERKKRPEGYNKIKAINDWKRETQRIYILNISTVYNPDLIEWLEKHKPYQNAIKHLICAQINREERAKKKRRETLKKKKELAEKQNL